MEKISYFLKEMLNEVMLALLPLFIDIIRFLCEMLKRIVCEVCLRGLPYDSWEYFFIIRIIFVIDDHTNQLNYITKFIHLLCSIH